jgi:uncharacterized membrane protein YgaE (UPF0421/DUF939 family)
MTGHRRYRPLLSAAAGGARRRLSDAGWSVLQTPVAAGLAWYIAHDLLGHHDPFFAPTAAAVSLSKDRVLRGQHALQLMVGVMLGIGIGVAVKLVAGSGPGGSGTAAIAVGVLLSLVATLALGGGFFQQGVLFVNQSVTSVILMITVTGAATSAATGSERVTDALIGGGVTLVITVILFPAAPLPLIQGAVEQVFAALREALAQLAGRTDPGEAPSPEWALQAGQSIQGRLSALQQARSAARQVANIAPLRWLERARVRQADERTMPLYLLAANVSCLAHASTARSISGEAQPRALREAMAELGLAFGALAEGADDAVAAKHATTARTLVAAAGQANGPHQQLVARLVETCADDTLRFTGQQGNVPQDSVSQ